MFLSLQSLQLDILNYVHLHLYCLKFWKQSLLIQLLLIGNQSFAFMKAYVSYFTLIMIDLIMVFPLIFHKLFKFSQQVNFRSDYTRISLPNPFPL